MIPPGTGDNCTGHCLAWDRALPAVSITEEHNCPVLPFSTGGWNSAWILRDQVMTLLAGKTRDES